MVTEGIITLPFFGDTVFIIRSKLSLSFALFSFESVMLLLIMLDCSLHRLG